jgi:hypothetical protein
MAQPTFSPQPYPLYAVIYQRVDEPVRLIPAADPLRLVVGWLYGAAGLPTPVLSASPGLEEWTGLAVFLESRDQAEATVSELTKAARSGARSQAVQNLLDNLPG